MARNGIEHLRVLIANERRDRLELLAQVVTGLGHEVIAREIDVKEIGAVTAREHPDVALVGLGLSSEHALELIGEIVHEASCPVIALLAARDPAYVHEAAKRGVFAYIVDTTPEELQSAIDITLQLACLIQVAGLDASRPPIDVLPQRTEQSSIDECRRNPAGTVDDGCNRAASRWCRPT